MVSASPEFKNDAPSAFVQETSAVIGRLRLTLNDIFARVPGGIHNSYDGHRYFGIDTKLSWQLFKISSAENEMALASYVPAFSSMQKFLKAAYEKGIPGDIITAVEKAYKNFEKLVDIYAGDRTRFNSMIQGIDGTQENPHTDIRHRKAIFAGHSHFWGTQIETYTVTFIMHAGSIPGRYDYVHIRSKSGIFRLRPDADIILDTIKMTDTRGSSDAVQRMALVQNGKEPNEAGLISHFSSEPLPQLATERKSDGYTITRLTGDAVGRKNCVNVAFGHVWRNAPISPWLDSKRNGFGTAVKITYPTKLLIVDVLTHKSAFSSLEAHSAVYGHASVDGDVGDIMRTQMQLPFREHICKLPGARHIAPVPEVPEYNDLIKYCFNQINWSIQDFNLYRLRMEYPLMDTLVSAWFHTDEVQETTYTSDWQI